MDEIEIAEKVVEKLRLEKPIPLDRNEIFRLALALGIIQECKGPKRHFFRIKPYTDDFPTKKQLQQRLKLAEEAYKRFGTKGTVKLPDGREINKVVYELGQVLRKPKEPKPILTDEQLIKILERFPNLALKLARKE
jgi:hypothetical protein